MYYATHSTTARNDAAQAAAGIGLILGPDQLARVGRLSVPTWGRRYALDNGAWSAFTTGRQFDGARFWSLLERFGDTFNPRARFAGSCQRPDWIVCPDIVAGGMDSLRLSLDWLPYVAQYGHPLIAVQDGRAAAGSGGPCRRGPALRGNSAPTCTSVASTASRGSSGARLTGSIAATERARRSGQSTRRDSVLRATGRYRFRSLLHRPRRRGRVRVLRRCG